MSPILAHYLETQDATGGDLLIRIKDIWTKWVEVYLWNLHARWCVQWILDAQTALVAGKDSSTRPVTKVIEQVLFLGLDYAESMTHIGVQSDEYFGGRKTGILQGVAFVVDMNSDGSASRVRKIEVPVLYPGTLPHDTEVLHAALNQVIPAFRSQFLHIKSVVIASDGGPAHFWCRQNFLRCTILSHNHQLPISWFRLAPNFGKWLYDQANHTTTTCLVRGMLHPDYSQRLAHDCSLEAMKAYLEKEFKPSPPSSQAKPFTDRMVFVVTKEQVWEQRSDSRFYYSKSGAKNLQGLTSTSFRALHFSPRLPIGDFIARVAPCVDVCCIAWTAPADAADTMHCNHCSDNQKDALGSRVTLHPDGGNNKNIRAYTRSLFQEYLTRLKQVSTLCVVLCFRWETDHVDMPADAQLGPRDGPNRRASRRNHSMVQRPTLAGGCC